MKQTFTISYLMFYLKSSILLEDNFIKTSNPNTILKLIPLGSENKTIPVDQIASVNDSFRLDIKSFIWGIVLAFIGLAQVRSSFLFGLILLAYGVLTAVSAFQTLLTINMASGVNHSINVIIFEKEKALSCKSTIENLIQNRYNNTNVTANTDRLIDAIKN